MASVCQDDSDEDLRSEIIRELARGDSADINRLRRLVLSGGGVPGLLLAERRQVWLHLLDIRHIDSLDAGVAGSAQSLADAHVLDADVKRTRQEKGSVFRDESWRCALHDTLWWYCAQRGVAYRQGLNEIAAPITALWEDPATAKREARQLLAAVVDRLCIGLYNNSPIDACRLFGSVLAYIEPRLACELCETGLTPAVYATPWLLTLGTKAAINLELGARVLEVLCAAGPSFVFFLGVALLADARADAETLMACLHIDSAATLRNAVERARQAEGSSPDRLRRRLERCATSVNDVDRLLPNRLAALSCGTLPALGPEERVFWVPPVFSSASDLDRHFDAYILVDLAPAGHASRLAAGRPHGALWPLGLVATNRRGVASWVATRLLGDRSLQSKRVCLLSESDSRRKRDALAELLLPRPFYRTLLAKSVPPDDSFSEEDDNDDASDDNEFANVDHLALEVCWHLRSLGIPSVSILECGGFAKFVQLSASSSSKLQARLPEFDHSAWTDYLRAKLALRRRCAASSTPAVGTGSSRANSPVSPGAWLPPVLRPLEKVRLALKNS